MKFFLKILIIRILKLFTLFNLNCFDFFFLQENIKLVFEGSCKLIHIRPIVKKCEHFADEFAPELVDMLSSYMNPTVICSLAGLCNNARIDNMLEDIAKKVR